MDIHAIQGDAVTHVLTTHRGDNDETPLHMISQARLERYWAIEASARVLAALLDGHQSNVDPSSASSG